MLPLMPLGFVCELQHRSGSKGDAAGVALVIAFLTVLALVGRIILLGEAASDRTQALVLVIGFSAFLAAFVTSLVVVWFAGNWWRWLRAASASLFCCGLFVPAAMFCFALENRIIAGNLEPGAIEDGRLGEIVWSIVGAMGLFTPTGMRYLIPWPLLVMGIAAALIFYRWPPKGMSRT
jgi:hypothetical protein